MRVIFFQNSIYFFEKWQFNLIGEYFFPWFSIKTLYQIRYRSNAIYFLFLRVCSCNLILWNQARVNRIPCARAHTFNTCNLAFIDTHIIGTYTRCDGQFAFLTHSQSKRPIRAGILAQTITRARAAYANISALGCCFSRASKLFEICQSLFFRKSLSLPERRVKSGHVMALSPTRLHGDSAEKLKKAPKRFIGAVPFWRTGRFVLLRI